MFVYNGHICVCEHVGEHFYCLYIAMNGIEQALYDVNE